MAKLGVGILIIPQKPWREVEKELAEYNTLYREVNGTDAPPPISAGWTFVDESAERAREMAMTLHRRLLPHRARPLPVRRRAHEEPAGYEYYAKMNEKLAVYGDQKAIEFFADLQVYGTPEQVYDKIMDDPQADQQFGLRRRVLLRRHAARGGGAQHAPVRAEVMPELKKFDAGAAIDRVAAAARPALRGGRRVRHIGIGVIRLAAFLRQRPSIRWVVVSAKKKTWSASSCRC